MPDSFALALTSTVFHIVSAVPYVRGILKKEVLPHPFSFLTWTVVSLVNFLALFKTGANWSLYPAGLHVFLIAFYAVAWFVAFRKVKAAKFDYFCLVFALAALPATFSWELALATAMTVAVDFTAFLPTIRKTWKDPSTEYAFPWFVAALFPAALFFAIGTPSFSNAAFWAYSACANFAFTAMVLYRRRIAARHGEKSGGS